MAAGSTSPYLLALFLIVSMLHNSLGDLNDILTSCCVEGIKWAVDGGRCDSFGSKLNVSREDIGSCMAIIEVCCMKEVHLQKCAEGKQTALDNKICIMRDIEPGREQYMECCHCCKLGLTARSYGLSCESPVYGDPCDTKFVECCTGREISINQSAADLLKDTRWYNHKIRQRDTANSVAVLRCGCDVTTIKVGYDEENKICGTDCCTQV